MDIDFSKDNGLVPVIIQNNNTSQVLMLGYMNQEAFNKTQTEHRQPLGLAPAVPAAFPWRKMFWFLFQRLFFL